jgi:hypothetical protein
MTSKNHLVINLREITALDMTLNGKWLIWAEFVTGALGGLALAYLLDLGRVVTFWLVGVGANYIPLMIYASFFLMKDNYQEIGERIKINNDIKRYNIQQGLVFIPFFFVLLALTQEFQKLTNETK